MSILHKCGARMRNPFKRGERGQSLVEMTLAIPFLLILIWGIVEVGNALLTYVTVSNTAREGARFAASLSVDYEEFPVETRTAILDRMAQSASNLEFDEEHATVWFYYAETDGEGHIPSGNLYSYQLMGTLDSLLAPEPWTKIDAKFHLPDDYVILVEMSYLYTPWIGPVFLPNPIRMTSHTAMRWEQ